MFDRFIINWSELAQQDLITALIGLGVASLLAFLIGWILRNFAVKKWRNRFNAKSEEYTLLDADYNESKSLLEIRENDNIELNTRLEKMSFEFDSLNSTASALKAENETALQKIASMPEPVVVEEEELVIDTDGDGIPDKPMGWMDKVMGVFAKPEKTEEEIDEEKEAALKAELELKEKYESASKMVDRLIAANEKLEAENESFKSKVGLLNDEVSAAKDTAKVKAEPAAEVVVEKADVEKYTASLTEARVTGTKLLERIQELEIYNGKIIKELEEAKTTCNHFETKVAKTGDFEAKYNEMVEKFEKAEIKNNSVVADLKLAQTSNVKTDTTALDAKVKELDKCNATNKSLQAKLDGLLKDVDALQKEKTELANKAKSASNNAAEAQAKAAKDAEAKKAAEAKAKEQEQAAAKAKAEKEAAAKKEAEAKKAADAKAKQEAEAKAIADKEAKDAAAKKIADEKAAEAKKAADAKAKQAAEAKAKAEADAKAAKEEEAKKAAAAKAKQEADAKKAAEAKAKAEAEAKAKAEASKPKQQEIKLDTQDDVMERIKAKAANIEFDRIGRGDSNKRDDLKEIKGIGPFIEKKLNALGIYNFSQIANFNAEDGDKVNEAIEFFPGRVKRDNWIGQAKKLM